MDPGRPEYWTGAHTVGHNKGSIGICLLGKDFFTPAQLESLGKLVKELQGRYPGSTVHGHNEFSSKTCPNFNVQEWYKELTNGPG